MTTTDTIVTFEDWLLAYPPFREQRAAIYESLIRIIGVLQALEKQPGLTSDARAVLQDALRRWHQTCSDITQP